MALLNVGDLPPLFITDGRRPPLLLMYETAGEMGEDGEMGD